MTHKALVIGYRSGLAKALQRLGIPAHYWVESPTKVALAVDQVTVQPLGRSARQHKAYARALASHGPFSHVIACTEAAVVPASHARRELDARRSIHTKVLRCHDKQLMKEMLRQHGIPMTDFVTAKDGLSGTEIADRLGEPVVVKSVAASGGRGIEFLSAKAAAEGIPLKGRIAERYVDAPEISVESFINRRKILFTNVTNYAKTKHINVLPNVLSEPTLRAVLQLNARVIEALNLDWGITHLEMYLTEEGPIFGEIALRPPGGYIMDLMSLSYGFDSWDAFARVELDLPFSPPRGKPTYSAAIVLHPGEGRVRTTFDVQALRRQPDVARANLKIAPGDTVSARLGVGSDVGYVILNHAEHTALLERATELDTQLHRALRLE